MRADICVVLNCKTYTAPPFLPPTPPHLERTECRGYCPVLVCERNVFTPNENWDGPHRRTPAYCVACIKSRMELSKLLACMRPVPCQKFECWCIYAPSAPQLVTSVRIAKLCCCIIILLDVLRMPLSVLSHSVELVEMKAFLLRTNFEWITEYAYLIATEFNWPCVNCYHKYIFIFFKICNKTRRAILQILVRVMPESVAHSISASLSNAYWWIELCLNFEHLLC